MNTLFTSYIISIYYNYSTSGITHSRRGHGCHDPRQALTMPCVSLSRNLWASRLQWTKTNLSDGCRPRQSLRRSVAPRRMGLWCDGRKTSIIRASPWRAGCYSPFPLRSGALPEPAPPSRPARWHPLTRG